MSRLISYIRLISEDLVLVESFIVSNFNYCPAIWQYCNEKDPHEMEKSENMLLGLSMQTTNVITVSCWQIQHVHSETKTIPVLFSEIYKTASQIRPNYMESLIIWNYLKPKAILILKALKFLRSKGQPNHHTFSLESFRYQDTLLWNSLPEEIKRSTTLLKGW